MARGGHQRGTARRPEPSAPVRYFPRRGGKLTLADVRGPWRPSGTVEAGGMFAIVWSAWWGDFWAPLHDFEPAAQLRLVDACRRLDRVAGFPGAWPDGRAD